MSSHVALLNLDVFREITDYLDRHALERVAHVSRDWRSRVLHRRDVCFFNCTAVTLDYRPDDSPIALHLALVQMSCRAGHDLTVDLRLSNAQHCYLVLARALEECAARLTSIKIWWNCDVEFPLTTISRPFPKLVSLDLSRHDARSLRALPEIVPSLIAPNLESLDIGGICLTDVALPQLANVQRMCMIESPGRADPNSLHRILASFPLLHDLELGVEDSVAIPPLLLDDLRVLQGLTRLVCSPTLLETLLAAGAEFQSTVSFELRIRSAQEPEQEVLRGCQLLSSLVCNEPYSIAFNPFGCDDGDAFSALTFAQQPGRDATLYCKVWTTPTTSFSMWQQSIRPVLRLDTLVILTIHLKAFACVWPTFTALPALTTLQLCALSEEHYSYLAWPVIAHRVRAPLLRSIQLSGCTEGNTICTGWLAQFLCSCLQLGVHGEVTELEVEDAILTTQPAGVCWHGPSATYGGLLVLRPPQ